MHPSNVAELLPKIAMTLSTPPSLPRMRCWAMVWVIMLALVGNAIAAPAGISAMPGEEPGVKHLMLHGTQSGQFVVIIRRVDDLARPGQTRVQSTIRYRAAGAGQGQWQRYASFQSQVLGITDRGGDLVVLLERPRTDGQPGYAEGRDREWRTVVNTDGRPSDRLGPPVPPGYRLHAMSGGPDDRLFALASMPGAKPTLFELDGREWRLAGSGPADLEPRLLARARLTRFGKRLVLAGFGPDGTIQTYHSAPLGTEAADEMEWSHAGSIAAEPGGSFDLLADGELNILWVYVWGRQEEQTDRIVPLVGRAAGTGEVVAVGFELADDAATQLAASDARAAGVAVGTPRVIRAVRQPGRRGSEDFAILEVLLDPWTAEARSGEVVVLGSPQRDMTRQDEILQLVFWGLLALAVLTFFRRPPLTAVPQLEELMRKAAPLGLRLGAGLVDISPVIASAGLVWSVGGDFSDEMQASIWFAGVGLYVAQPMVLEWLGGRSLGKVLFGLRVVSLDGAAAGAGAIILRNILRILDLLSLGASLVFVPFTPLRQRIGDMAAGTIVIRDGTPAEEPIDTEEAVGG